MTEMRAQATKFMVRAEELYVSGDYPGALESLRSHDAIRESRHSDLLMGQICFELRNDVDAVAAMRRYFDEQNHHGSYSTTYLSGDLANVGQNLDRVGEHDLANWCFERITSPTESRSCLPSFLKSVSTAYPCHTNQELRDRAYALATRPSDAGIHDSGTDQQGTGLPKDQFLANIDFAHSNDPIVMFVVAINRDLNLELSDRIARFEALLKLPNLGSEFREIVWSSYETALVRSTTHNTSLMRDVRARASREGFGPMPVPPPPSVHAPATATERAAARRSSN
jgi:hypothetical protein